MKKEIIAIVGLGYWGTIVTNTVVSMNKFRKIYVFDNDTQKIKNIKKNLVIRLNTLVLIRLKMMIKLKTFF